MTRKEKAVEAALESIEHVARHDPVAPALPIEDEIVCQGLRRSW